MGAPYIYDISRLRVTLYGCILLVTFINVQTRFKLLHHLIAAQQYSNLSANRQTVAHTVKPPLTQPNSLPISLCFADSLTVYGTLQGGQRCLPPATAKLRNVRLQRRSGVYGRQLRLSAVTLWLHCYGGYGLRIFVHLSSPVPHLQLCTMLLILPT